MRSQAKLSRAFASKCKTPRPGSSPRAAAASRMSQDTDPETGRLRDNPFRPWIVITPKDSKAAFIRFAGVSMRRKETGRRLKQYKRGRFLDLRTLGWALRN